MELSKYSGTEPSGFGSSSLATAHHFLPDQVMFNYLHSILNIKLILELDSTAVSFKENTKKIVNGPHKSSTILWLISSKVNILF